MKVIWKNDWKGTNNNRFHQLINQYKHCEDLKLLIEKHYEKKSEIDKFKSGMNPHNSLLRHFNQKK